MAERNEAVEMDRGSRSALIVAPESRETDPRKPVSSQGGRRFYGTATGKHGMNSESFRNVLTRQWRIATGRKTVKPRNRMPETGASGSVGAPLEESGALPGNSLRPTFSGSPLFIPFRPAAQALDRRLPSPWPRAQHS